MTLQRGEHAPDSLIRPCLLVSELRRKWSQEPAGNSSPTRALLLTFYTGILHTHTHTHPLTSTHTHNTQLLRLERVYTNPDLYASIYASMLLCYTFHLLISHLVSKIGLSIRSSFFPTSTPKLLAVKFLVPPLFQPAPVTPSLLRYQSCVSRMRPLFQIFTGYI